MKSKRILALLMAMTMILTLWPSSAFAADPEPHEHCTCGSTHRPMGGHATEVPTTFTAWTEDYLPNTSGNYYLTKDYEISTAWNMPSGTVLCLNGHTIKNKGNNSTASYVDSVIKIASGNCVITDCTGNGVICRPENTDSRATAGCGRGISSTGNSLSLFNITIKDCTIYSGTTDNQTNGGAGIYATSALTMRNCKIQNCTTAIRHNAGIGGGICIYYQASIDRNYYFDNVTIEDCNASWGGGLFIKHNSHSIVDIKNSIIRNCTATGPSCGAGAMENNGVTTLTNVTITGCSTDGSGGAIKTTDTLNIRDNCTITENSAGPSRAYGGGIYVASGFINFSGDNINIHSNTARNTEDNIYLYYPVSGRPLLTNGITNSEVGLTHYEASSVDIPTVDNAVPFTNVLSITNIDGFKADNPDYGLILDEGIMKFALKATSPSGIDSYDCTTLLNNNGKITGVTDVMEYKLASASSWTPVPVSATEIAGLGSGSYQVRLKAAPPIAASDAVPVTIAEFEGSKEATPDAKFSVVTMKLTDVSAGMKYCIDGGDWTDIDDDEVDLATEVSGPCTITVYKPGNGLTTIDSDEQEITVDKATAPSGLTGIRPSVSGRSDGQIIGTSESMEISTDETVWTDCSDTTTAGLAAGSYFIRVKASGTTLPSDSESVTVPAGPALVTALDLSELVIAPGKNNTPQDTFTGNAQYTGTIVWTGSPEKFLGGTSYTATLTLVPTSDYTFTSLLANAFIHTDAETVSNPADSGVVTLIFPATEPAQVSSIVIKNSASKLAYKIGDSLDVTGLVITATYDDGTTADVPVTTAMISGFDSSAYNTAKTLTINYGGKTASYDVLIDKLPSPAAPAVTFSLSDAENAGKIMGATDAMEYSTGGGIWHDCTDNIQLGISDPCTLSVRLKETATTYCSSPSDFTITAGTVPSDLTGLRPSVLGNSDGKITGTAVSMEYSSDGISWADCSDTETTGLAAGTYQVRAKADGLVLASEATSVTVPDGYMNMDVVSANYEDAYDGNAHSISITGEPDEAVIKYRTASSGDYTLSVIPEFTDYTNGPKTVYFKVTAAGYNDYEGSATVNITKLDISGATVGSFAPMTYRGSAQTPSAAVTCNGLDVTGSWSDVINVSDKTTFTADADGNFTGTIANQITGMAKKPVDALTLSSLITVPVKNETPQSSFTDQTQFTGTIAWEGTPAKFLGGATYTAKLNLTATANYTFTGLAADRFIHTGASTVTNAADSGLVTLIFPATEDAVVDSIAIKTAASKTTYYVGDSLDVTDLEITATYDDATTKDFPVTASMVSGFTSSAAGNITLTIELSGKTVTYDVTIVKYPAPAAPDNLVGVKPTDLGGSDGKITGTTALMEISSDGSSWSDCTAAETSGLTSGTYQVRLKETTDTLAGSAVSVTVPEGDATMVITTDNYSAIYDGEAHGITISGIPDGATVLYKLNFADDYTITDPVTFTDFTNGPKTVFFKITADGYHDYEGLDTVNITKKTVDALALDSLVTVPVRGNTPQATITTPQYTGTISWSDNPETFKEKTVYTATIALTPTDNYKFAGLAENSFAHAGADSITNDADGNTVTIVFPATADKPRSPGKPAGSEPTVTEPASNNPFVDVKESKYYYDPITWAVKNGITEGVDKSHFAPNGNASRAQMITFLWRAAGCPEPVTTECPFTDVSKNKYYYKAVLWAVEQGITEGISPSVFDTDSTVTRAQAMTFVYRFAKASGSYSTNPFNDVSKKSYYFDAVTWAVENNITEGTSANTFSPKADCVRGQIVTFLYRYFVK